MATATTKTKTGSAAKAEPTIEDLQAQIETLKNDISEIIRTGRDFGQSQANRAVDRAKSQAADLRSEGERYAAEAGRRASETLDTTIETIRQKPGTSVAIAAGIGFLFGLMMSGRR